MEILEVVRLHRPECMQGMRRCSIQKCSASAGTASARCRHDLNWNLGKQSKTLLRELLQVCRVDGRIDAGFDERMTIEASKRALGHSCP